MYKGGKRILTPIVNEGKKGYKEGAGDGPTTKDSLVKGGKGALKKGGRAAVGQVVGEENADEAIEVGTAVGKAVAPIVKEEMKDNVYVKLGTAVYHAVK